jgi:hypothetical protein
MSGATKQFEGGCLCGAVRFIATGCHLPIIWRKSFCAILCRSVQDLLDHGEPLTCLTPLSAVAMVAGTK